MSWSRCVEIFSTAESYFLKPLIHLMFFFFNAWPCRAGTGQQSRQPNDIIKTTIKMYQNLKKWHLLLLKIKTFGVTCRQSSAVSKIYILSVWSLTNFFYSFALMLDVVWECWAGCDSSKFFWQWNLLFRNTFI